MKTCNKCGEVKELAAFTKRTSNTDGRTNDCTACLNVMKRNSAIQRRYNMPLEVIQEMLNRGCAVCGSKEDLCIDHDHKCCSGMRSCGKCVRGVLCRNHNLAEGYTKTWDSAYALSTYMARDIDIKEVLNSSGAISFA